MYNYRKMWEDINGPIPRDEYGRTFEIHHKDGNRANNNLENLLCVSILEHLDIHYAQQDWGAVAAILLRLESKDHNTIKQAASIWSTDSNKQRLSTGTHNFTSIQHRQIVSQTQKQRMASGQHPFQQQDNSSLGKKSATLKKQRWRNLADDEFFELLKTYKFIITRLLRNGKQERCVNKAILQAICEKYENEDKQESIFNQLREYHNVNETCLFIRQHNKDKWGRRKRNPT